MSWLFKSVMKRHDLTTNPIAVTKTSKASKKEHNYHKPEDIRRMLRVQNAKSVVEWRMNMAGILMYEGAMRRQDVLSLTWSHLLRPGLKTGDFYMVTFYSQKQNKDRSVFMKKEVIDLVREQKKREEKSDESELNLDEKILKYSSIESFGGALKRFLTKNGYPGVQSHDFRVSKAT